MQRVCTLPPCGTQLRCQPTLEPNPACPIPRSVCRYLRDGRVVAEACLPHAGAAPLLALLLRLLLHADMRGGSRPLEQVQGCQPSIAGSGGPQSSDSQRRMKGGLCGLATSPRLTGWLPRAAACCAACRCCRAWRAAKMRSASCTGKQSKGVEGGGPSMSRMQAGRRLGRGGASRWACGQASGQPARHAREAAHPLSQVSLAVGCQDGAAPPLHELLG